MRKQKKKQQHYVPKFYLKYFSHQGLGKQISLWNGPKQIYVKDAKLADQAYENNFYGSDGFIEDTLSILESKAAIVISDIIINEHLPTEGSEDRIALYIFIMFQAERTKASAIDMDKHADSMMRFVFKDDPKFKKYLQDIKLKLNVPAAQKLVIAAPLVPLILDLSSILIINDSIHEFITSDNPVVRYNQFLELRKWPGSGSGWSLPGLQVIFPISPKHMLFLYDKDVYSFINNENGIIRISSLSDINWLNGLQYLVAEDNIYFSSKIDEKYAIRMHRRWSKHRKPRITLQEYKQVSKEGDSQNGSLLVSTMNNIRVDMELSFIKYAIDPYRKLLSPTLYNPRNEYIKNVLEEIEKQKYK